MGRREPNELAKTRNDHRRSKVNEEMAEEAKKKVVKAWGKLLPFGAQVVASAAAYTVGVTATQLMGFVCKVSCATPVLGPCMGLVGVGVASALAGQASKHTHKMISTGTSPLKPGFWEPLDVDDMFFDALLGIFMFKAMGGRFSSLMPSDLSKPGALAFESIPARTGKGEAYAQPSVKRELARIFRRDGCHHCGSYRGPVIGDHMPPNKLVAGKGTDKLAAAMGELPGISKVRELIGLAGRTGKTLQRFYPQCQRCSIKQATAMRSGKRVLVLHLHAPRYRSEHMAGIFVGIRHNVPPVSFAEAPGHRGGGKLPLALIAAAPAAEAADSAAAEAEGTASAAGSSSSGAPQLLVEELSTTPSWELQAYMPGAAVPCARAHGSSGNSSGSFSRSIGHSQQQQQQQYSSSHSRHGSYHNGNGVGGSNNSGSNYKQQERRGGSSVAPQALPGSLGLVQQQLADVLQPQDRLVDGTSLLVAGTAKQRADAAFERFAGGLAR